MNPLATVTDIALFRARGPREPKPPRECTCPDCMREVWYPYGWPPPTTQETQP